MTTANENTVTEPRIGLENLEAIVQIIDYASKKGAFDGSDLSFVGKHRDAVALFVNFTKEQLAKKEETENTESVGDNG